MTTLEALFRRHTHALDRKEQAFLSHAKIPHIKGRVSIPEMYDINPRLTSATEHYEIDEVCEAYIAHCRKRGKWTGLHTPKRGRLDAGGVFHEAKKGEFLQPGPTPKFDRDTLRAYRDRIKDYHERLDRSILAAQEKNNASGNTAAENALGLAYLADYDAFADILDLITRRTGGAQIARILRYGMRADARVRRAFYERPDDLQGPGGPYAPYVDRIAAAVVDTHKKKRGQR